MGCVIFRPWIAFEPVDAANTIVFAKKPKSRSIILLADDHVAAVLEGYEMGRAVFRPSVSFEDDPRLVGIAPFHFDDSVSYPAELVTGFRNMPETLKAWTEIGRQIVANANRSFANAGAAASWHEVLREMPAAAAKGTL